MAELGREAHVFELSVRRHDPVVVLAECQLADAVHLFCGLASWERLLRIDLDRRDHGCAQVSVAVEGRTLPRHLALDARYGLRLAMRIQLLQLTVDAVVSSGRLAHEVGQGAHLLLLMYLLRVADRVLVCRSIGNHGDHLVRLRRPGHGARITRRHRLEARRRGGRGRERNDTGLVVAVVEPRLNAVGGFSEHRGLHCLRR